MKNVILRILIFALISLKLLVHIALMFSVKGAHYVFVWIACVQARVDRKENRGLGILRFHYTLYTHCRSFINFSGWPLYGAMGNVHQQHVLIVSMTTYPGISLWFRVIHLLQKVLLSFFFFLIFHLSDFGLSEGVTCWMLLQVFSYFPVGPTIQPLKQLYCFIKMS